MKKLAGRVEAIRFLEDLQRLRKNAEFEERELARELAAREAAKPLPRHDPPTLRFVLTTDQNPSCNLLPRPVHNRPRRRSRISGYRL